MAGCTSITRISHLKRRADCQVEQNPPIRPLVASFCGFLTSWTIRIVNASRHCRAIPRMTGAAIRATVDLQRSQVSTTKLPSWRAGCRRPPTCLCLRCSGEVPAEPSTFPSRSIDAGASIGCASPRSRPLPLPLPGRALLIAMSSQDGHLPPPPPPRQGPSAASAPLRRCHGLAQQPPTISTVSLTGPQPGISAWSASTVDSATPLSPYASMAYSPFAQHYPSLPGGTSPMALRAPAGMVMEYNPQEWGRGGPTGGVYRPHASLQAQASREVDPLNGRSARFGCEVPVVLTIFHRHSITTATILSSVFAEHYAWYPHVFCRITIPTKRVRVQQSSKQRGTSSPNSGRQ
jgi:hypothetical protein